MTKEISVPDIGDFESVEIIEILVKPGDTINKNDPVVTLESDKSSVEVPSPFAGKISALKVKIGDKVSTGSVLALIDDEKAKVKQQSSEQEKEKTKRFKLASKKDVILGIIRLLLSNIYDRDSLSKETISLMQTNLPQHFVDNHYSNEETFDKIYEGIQFLYVLNGHKFTSGSWIPS